MQVVQLSVLATDIHRSPASYCKGSTEGCCNVHYRATSEECAGVTSAINPAQTLSIAGSEHASNLDDDVFDLAAPKKSLVASRTGNISSSIPYVLVGCRTSLEYAGLVVSSRSSTLTSITSPRSSLSERHRFFSAVKGQHMPEGFNHHEPGAYL